VLERVSRTSARVSGSMEEPAEGAGRERPMVMHWGEERSDEWKVVSYTP